MIYSIFVTGGLENIARQELNARFGDTDQFKIILRKPKRIVFQYNGNPKDLLSLRTADHLFLVIKHLKNMTRSRSSLASIRSSLNRFNFEEVIGHCRQVGIRIKKRIQFRVISRMSGFRNFQKRDLQQVVERVLIERGWKLTDSGTGIDVWNEVHGDDAYISIRLSTSDMAQRSGRQVRVPQSIKPTLAFGLVWLSQPQTQDIFLDPMCGAGTILLERANSGRYSYLIGGDRSKVAVDATKYNFGRKHQPCQFFDWSVKSLPIKENSVDKIVCHFPIEESDRISSELTNLYNVAVSQMKTVLKPGGKMVLLTLHQSVLYNILKRQKSLIIRQRLDVEVDGKRGRVFVIHSSKYTD